MSSPQSKLAQLDFSGLSVAVVGDLIADHYVVTEPRGLSREAPVMVLRHSHEYIGAGGAANVARNLKALGARTQILGAVGRDSSGREILQVLGDENVDASGLITVPGWTTPTKTRVFAAEPRRSRQQVLRMDREPQEPIDETLRRSLAEQVRGLTGVDAVVFSDYQYGLLDEHMAAAARYLAEQGTVCVLDPRRRVDDFAGLTALTPNIAELADLVGDPVELLEADEQVSLRGRELRERLGLRWLLVTRGNRGMALFDAENPNGCLQVEASGRGNVTDVSGAGDTAAAAFALGLAAGLSGAESMALANAASGVVVMKSGAAVCSAAELRDAHHHAPAARPQDEQGSGFDSTNSSSRPGVSSKDQAGQVDPRVSQ